MPFKYYTVFSLFNKGFLPLQRSLVSLVIVILLNSAYNIHAQNCVDPADNVKNKTIVFGVNLNSLVPKQSNYRNTHFSSFPDGINQDVIVNEKFILGGGINISYLKTYKKMKSLELEGGLSIGLSLYRQYFKKKGYESDISFHTDGLIFQNSNILDFNLYYIFNIITKISSKSTLNFSFGLGVNSPFLSFGKKKWINGDASQELTVEWAYSELAIFISSPLKIEYYRKIKTRWIGIGLGTAITNTYVLPASKYLDSDPPEYSFRKTHRIGFNTFTYGSYKTYNDPTKSFIINLSITYRL